MATDPRDRLASITLLSELPQSVRQSLEKRCRWRSVAAQEQKTALVEELRAAVAELRED